MEWHVRELLYQNLVHVLPQIIVYNVHNLLVNSLENAK